MQPAAGEVARRPPLLDVEDLHYRAGYTQILRGVSFTLGVAELLVVMGASGSGKTTLLRCVNRLLEPTGGTIRLEGTDAHRLSPVELRRKVGMVGQLPFMFEGTIRDNLERAAGYSGTELTDDEYARLLSDVGLDEGLERDARRLSVGQQQRVAMARALVSRPRVLLCDEPTASLDRDSSRRLESTLTRMAGSGMGIIFVTHDGGQAARISERQLLLADGTLGPMRAAADEAGA